MSAFCASCYPYDYKEDIVPFNSIFKRRVGSLLSSCTLSSASSMRGTDTARSFYCPVGQLPLHKRSTIAAPHFYHYPSRLWLDVTAEKLTPMCCLHILKTPELFSAEQKWQGELQRKARYFPKINQNISIVKEKTGKQEELLDGWENS